jgi:hypothetical protein
MLRQAAAWQRRAGELPPEQRVHASYIRVAAAACCLNLRGVCEPLCAVSYQPLGGVPDSNPCLWRAVASAGSQPVVARAGLCGGAGSPLRRLQR